MYLWWSDSQKIIKPESGPKVGSSSSYFHLHECGWAGLINKYKLGSDDSKIMEHKTHEHHSYTEECFEAKPNPNHVDKIEEFEYLVTNFLHHCLYWLHNYHCLIFFHFLIEDEDVHTVEYRRNCDNEVINQ